MSNVFPSHFTKKNVIPVCQDVNKEPNNGNIQTRSKRRGKNKVGEERGSEHTRKPQDGQ